MAIDRKLRDLEVPRPLTHDLLQNMLEKLGAKLERIVLNDLKGGTFYALLMIRRGDELIAVDCRPSDAIALSVRTNAPIFAEEIVIKQTT
jgi:bifunctional DNase/RNase